MTANFTDADARAMWQAIRAQYPPDDDLFVRAEGDRGILPIARAVRSLFGAARLTTAPNVPPVLTIWTVTEAGPVPSVYHSIPIPEASPVDGAAVWRRSSDYHGSSIRDLQSRGLVFRGTVAEAVAEYRARIAIVARGGGIIRHDPGGIAGEARRDWRRGPRGG